MVLVDSYDPEALRQVDTVEEVLAKLGAANLPRLYLLNKVESVRDKSELAALYRHAPKAIPISALTGSGLDELEAALLSHLASCEETVDILVPHSAGALRAEIMTTTTVISEDHTEEGSLMRIRSNPRLLGQILARGARNAEDPGGPSRSR